MVNFGHETFADTLLSAARDQDVDKVHATFAVIHAFDGDSGVRAMIDTVLDHAVDGIPAPEIGERYGFSAIALTRDCGCSLLGVEDMPYELQWSMQMLTARLNRDAANLESLFTAAKSSDRLPSCALVLALVAAKASHLGGGK